MENPGLLVERAKELMKHDLRINTLKYLNYINSENNIDQYFATFRYTKKCRVHKADSSHTMPNLYRDLYRIVDVPKTHIALTGVRTERFPLVCLFQGDHFWLEPDGTIPLFQHINDSWMKKKLWDDFAFGGNFITPVELHQCCFMSDFGDITEIDVEIEHVNILMHCPKSDMLVIRYDT